MTERPTTLRFAVATFDTASGLRDALQALRREGLGDDAFNCLALDDVFAAAASLASLPAEARRMLRFPGNRRPISCTAGALAACLAERADTGVSTLKAALGLWLIPRHAEQIQNAVEQGSIVLWVRLLESDDEPLAYRALLAGSSQSVGVHDLVA